MAVEFEVGTGERAVLDDTRTGSETPFLFSVLPLPPSNCFLSFCAAMFCSELIALPLAAPTNGAVRGPVWATFALDDIRVVAC